MISSLRQRTTELAEALATAKGRNRETLSTMHADAVEALVTHGEAAAFCFPSTRELYSLLVLAGLVNPEFADAMVDYLTFHADTPEVRAYVTGLRALASLMERRRRAA
jgi:hypothetical protein